MRRAIVIRGRLQDSRHVELDEGVSGEVEVILSPTSERASKEDVSNVMMSLQGGDMSREEIDAQLIVEREAGWP